MRRSDAPNALRETWKLKLLRTFRGNKCAAWGILRHVLECSRYWPPSRLMQEQPQEILFSYFRPVRAVTRNNCLGNQNGVDDEPFWSVDKIAKRVTRDQR